MLEVNCSSSNVLREMIHTKKFEHCTCDRFSFRLSVVANFVASWAPQCTQVTDAIKILSEEPVNQSLKFLNVSLPHSIDNWPIGTFHRASISKICFFMFLGWHRVGNRHCKGIEYNFSAYRCGISSKLNFFYHKACRKEKLHPFAHSWFCCVKLDENSQHVSIDWYDGISVLCSHVRDPWTIVLDK